MSTQADAPDETTPRVKNERLRRAARKIIPPLAVLAPFLFLPLLVPIATGQPLLRGYADHATYALNTLLPLLAIITHQAISYQRVNPPTPARGKPRKSPEAPLRSSWAIGKDTADIALFLDAPIQRLILAVLFVLALVTPFLFPANGDTWKALGGTGRSGAINTLLMGAAGPLMFWGYLRLHVGGIVKRRMESVTAIWQIAKDYLRYPKKLPARPTRAELRLMSPLIAVDVQKWKSLDEVDSAFVLTPSDVSVTEEKPWDEFDQNLNQRLPREGEWRVRRDPRGRGATIEAANYPTAVLWDGEVDPDPLTFFLGINLMTGKMEKLTLNDVSPHMLVTGGTSSGKTSGAEIMSAQMLTKPMPWDPTLFGQVHFLDPKGTLARRWRGRRGVVTSEGTADHYCEVDPETGDPLSGIEVMAMHIEAIEAERLRRDKILAKYPKAATWVHLPDDVKREERLAPILVVLDEFLDHTDKITGTSAQAARDRAARERLVELVTAQARKYRNVGMHTCLIAQEGKMATIGSSLVRQLPVRVVTGSMDPTQLAHMFGLDREIPSLPSSVKTEDGSVKTIPGRARFMNAGGQEIKRMQLMWFGGKTNSDTLDKYLPQGEEPPNGDFTPATGGTPAADADPTDTTFTVAAGEYERISPAEAELDAANDPTMGGQDVAGEDEPGPGNDTDTDDNFAPTSGEDTGDSESPDGTGSSIAAPIDPDATFPTAAQEHPLCSHEGCANDAEQVCAAGGEKCCAMHLFPSPGDPTMMVCANCYWDHPIADAELAEAWVLMQQLAHAAGDIDTSWQELPAGGVKLTASRRGGRKIVEVTGLPGRPPVARSSSGDVTGADAVLDRVTDALRSKA